MNRAANSICNLSVRPVVIRYYVLIIFILEMPVLIDVKTHCRGNEIANPVRVEILTQSTGHQFDIATPIPAAEVMKKTLRVTVSYTREHAQIVHVVYQISMI